jgi:putative intracellular protease/amidase
VGVDSSAPEKNPELPAQGAGARDADGLLVREHPRNALFVVPAIDFGDEALRYVRSCLFVRSIGSKVFSTAGSQPLRGRLQDFFVGDGELSSAVIDGFDALVFCGGEGALTLSLNPDALRLAREARLQRKPIAAWGDALAILANADVVRGARVTGSDSTRRAVERAGGKFSGRQLEVHSGLCTGRDEAVGMRLGRAFADLLHNPQRSS